MNLQQYIITFLNAQSCDRTVFAYHMIGVTNQTR